MLSGEQPHPPRGGRRASARTVLEQVHLAGPLSRAELTRLTGLNRSTVKGIVDELGAEGLVMEGAAEPRKTPGRPSRVVRVCSERLAVLAVEIAVDFVAVATVGLGGTVHRQARVSRSREHLDVESTRSAVRELAASVIDARVPIMGAGVAVVGIVRRGDGVVRLAPNLGWRDVELASLTRGTLAALGVDCPVWVGNEADFGALAEHRRGAARAHANMVYLSGEVGIGGGLIVDGQPLVGAAGYGGEIGHIPVNPDGRTCGCGGQGCWETEAGKAALLRHAGQPAEDPHGDAVERVMAAAAAGDEAATAAVDAVGAWLGIGLAGLVNILNPELIVLGGMYGRTLPAMRQPIRERMTRHTIGPTAEGTAIVAASLGLDAPLLGAAEFALEPVLDGARPVPLVDA
ncbi:ROK family protein [Egibacter rhizosphaerae]|uniref:ROK family protein n=1 Tax=Egibacter rhizosphaerae TaxID=1670831 RepID=A0A411YHN5_9ACTN|nr:ROK family protein [Egibacter rhizosphaerae]QBI20616.1 ROK family protein [Egibacter rhizosphaerae]